MLVILYTNWLYGSYVATKCNSSAHLGTDFVFQQGFHYCQADLLLHDLNE